MINLLYKTVINKILIILNSESGLKDIITKTIECIQTETKFSAVGIRLREGADFPYFVQKGFPLSFVHLENSILANGEDTEYLKSHSCTPTLECTCGLVISGQTDPSNTLFTNSGSFWTNNSAPILDIPLDKDPRFHPRNTCIHLGYRSLAIIPIKAHGQIIGTLQINDYREGVLSPELIHFFEDVCISLGSTLMRKQAEEGLIEREKYLEEIQAIAKIGSYKFNFLSDKWESNKIMDSIFGIGPEYPKTFEAWLFLVHPDSRDMMADYFQSEVIGLKRDFDKEYKVTRQSDGAVLWVHGLGNLKYDENNQLVYMVGTISDITERKIAEIERNLVLNKLLKRNQDLEQFSYIVSHNLRAPLANMIGLTGILGEPGYYTEESKELVAHLSKSVLKLDTVIKDLNFILQSTDDINEKKEWVEFTQLVDDIKFTLSDLIKEENASINTFFGSCSQFFTIKGFLYSVFYNLILNSIKYRKNTLGVVNK